VAGEVRLRTFTQSVDTTFSAAKAEVASLSRANADLKAQLSALQDELAKARNDNIGKGREALKSLKETQDKNIALTEERDRLRASNATLTNEVARLRKLLPPSQSTPANRK